jgi:nucleotide-binding universal stress UspA family protein
MALIGPTSRIVVGIDGSDASKGALVWAIGQAKLTGATLEAVIAFKLPTGAYGEPAILPGDLDFEGEARRTLGDVIAEALDNAGPEGCEVLTTVVEDNPTVALLRASESADLLVVGASGHGSVVGALIGSVSEYCVHHATCPVVVVRHSPR